MKRVDLKTGMVIETREGKMGLVLLNTSKGDVIGGCGNAGGSTWCESITRNYRDDLTSPYGDRADIVAVYNSTSNLYFGSTDKQRLDLIWKRPVEPIEMTIQEIAEKLGIDTNRLKIVEKK